MRSWRVTPVHISILESLSEGKSLRKIAFSLSLNHSTVIRHVKQLEQRGYVSRQVRSNQVFYSILPAGISIMHHPVSETLTGGSKHAPPPEEIKIRLHRLQIKFDLVNPVRDPSIIKFKDFPSKIVPLEHWQKNIIQFEDFTAIISTKSLIITGVQRYLKASEDIESQEADVMSEIIPFAEQVEDKIRRITPSFRLKRLDRGVLSGKIISREFAYEDHPVARIVERKIGDLTINAEDGKPRIWVDSSNGPPELETGHLQTAAEDAETVRKNTYVFGTQDLGKAIQVLATQVSITTELAKHQAVTQDQMDQVVAALGNITKIIGGMTA